MIESFKLANVATYQQAGIEVTNLKEINFFYGANGSGKTTISNYLAHSSHNEERFNNCGITWKNNNSLQTLVYNKEFREKNFSSSNIAGVFTLGEATTEQVIAINNKRDEQDTINIQLNDYIAQHKIKTKEINSTHAEITEKSWSLYKKYEPNFKEALKGFQKKELFKTNILSVSKTLQTLDANINIDNLKNRSITILGERPTVYQKIYMPDVTALINIEQDSIWNTIVTGQSDIDISGLIESLGCQDWVNHGRKFMTSSNKCPFCQKETIDDEFREKIELFFDRSFEDRIKKINELTFHYQQQVTAIIDGFKYFIAKEKENINSKLNIEDFELALNVADSQFRFNIMEFKNKQEKPSELANVAHTQEVLKRIELLISQANVKIDEHNQVATNYDIERKKFIADVWIFLAAEIQHDIIMHNKKLNGLTKAIESLNAKIATSNSQLAQLKSEISELSRRTTSVQPAVDEINKLLHAYGFINFEIVPSLQLENHYVIQRQNGELAFDSLSEGEVTFITFLYFIQLANGALTQDQVAESRIVVIDDPISSLDSNVLYIVSAIVKGLIKEVKDGSSVKQLFIFTHNVYFHKEASFQNGRSNGCNKTHFWILRKANNITSIQPYLQKNPINSAYELMWQELKDRRNRSGLTIQNIMRRILENYFKILGKLSDDDIVAKFKNPEEQKICLSLLHWINDGSHCIPDDLFIQTIDDQTEVYLRIFKGIFVNSGHESHYNMMMAGDELFDGEFLSRDLIETAA